MRGDFTRFTHDPSKHYTAVLKQQGRVDLDADWNEQVEIQQYLSREGVGDTIGPCGVPKQGGGFQVVDVIHPAGGADLIISAGRIYVDGILCDLEQDTTYRTQPHLPHPPSLAPQQGRTDLVYLDVWQRHITAVEDPAIKEPALGGPDTATRLQTIYQVRTRTVLGAVRCGDEFGNWPPQPSDGLLSVQIPSTAPSQPCSLAPAGGYRGLENHLYRVEIHDAGGLEGAQRASFKWSRDNGSVVLAIESFVDGQPATRVQLMSLGPDEVLGLRVGDWVELLDDAHELSGTPGTLAQIVDIDEANRILTLSEAFSGCDPLGHPKVRRWDMADGPIPVADTAIPLEHGIHVRFSGGQFNSGDYWTFAARSATGSVEEMLKEPPQGIRHHYGKLALITWKQQGSQWGADVQDCRPEFSPLTEQFRFFHVSGDGQEAMPGDILPQPLQVAVMNGEHAVEGAPVRFQVTAGGGTLSAGGATGSELIVPTRLDGTAECSWQLGSAQHSQRVVATLLAADGSPFLIPLGFAATTSEADQVAYDPQACPILGGVHTVQQAIDALCQRELGSCTITVAPSSNWQAVFQQIDSLQNVHICFAAGDYALEGTVMLQHKGHVKVTGCGPATRIQTTQSEAALAFTNCQSVIVRDLCAESSTTGTRGEHKHLNGTLSFLDCEAVTVENVSLQCAPGTKRAASCITIRNADHFASLSTGRGLARIRHCDLVVGHLQTGILLVNVSRAQVEDNLLRVGQRPSSLGLEAMLPDKRYRAGLRKLLVSGAYVGAQPLERLDANAAVSFGGHTVHFRTASSIMGRGDWWGDLLAARPPVGIADGRELASHMERLADEILLNRGVVAGSTQFEQWYNKLRQEDHAVASQGIVVGGRSAHDVRILNNTVEDVLQGIHLGVSHRETAPGAPDAAGSVLISGNRIAVMLPPTALGERHGIFVGNCGSLLVNDNYLVLRKLSTTSELRVEGIRVYGHLGKRAILRQNHLDAFTVGIQFTPLSDFPSPLWLISDNVAFVEVAAEKRNKVRQSYNLA